MGIESKFKCSYLGAYTEFLSNSVDGRSGGAQRCTKMQGDAGRCTVMKQEVFDRIGDSEDRMSKPRRNAQFLND
jgi:hypothetical protein